MCLAMGGTQLDITDPMACINKIFMTAFKSIHLIEFRKKRLSYVGSQLICCKYQKGEPYERYGWACVQIPSQLESTLVLAMAEVSQTVDEKDTITTYDLNSLTFSKLLLSISEVEQHRQIWLHSLKVMVCNSREP
jgi:hypothetical protein